MCVRGEDTASENITNLGSEVHNIGASRHKVLCLAHGVMDPHNTTMLLCCCQSVQKGRIMGSSSRLTFLSCFMAARHGHETAA